MKRLIRNTVGWIILVVILVLPFVRVYIEYGFVGVAIVLGATALLVGLIFFAVWLIFGGEDERKEADDG